VEKCPSQIQSNNNSVLRNVQRFIYVPVKRPQSPGRKRNSSYTLSVIAPRGSRWTRRGLRRPTSTATKFLESRRLLLRQEAVIHAWAGLGGLHGLALRRELCRFDSLRDVRLARRRWLWWPQFRAPILKSYSELCSIISLTHSWCRLRHSARSFAEFRIGEMNAQNATASLTDCYISHSGAIVTYYVTVNAYGASPFASFDISTLCFFVVPPTPSPSLSPPQTQSPHFTPPSRRSFRVRSAFVVMHCRLFT
jgi:hypothetical protein